MSNLLEKASILLTPTAYDDGRILSVKPSIVLGSELVTNGDFASPDISMITGAGVRSIVNGELKIEESGLNYSQVIYSNILDSNKIYKATFDITLGTGSYVVYNTTNGSINITESGTHTFYLQNTNRFYVGSNGVGDVWYMDNISVKEDLSGDFDFTRNSSATRVNSQGLIEDMQTFGGNLVTNGDFSQEGSEQVTNGNFATDSDWNNSDGGNDWQIINGKLILTTTSSNNINQSIGLVQNKFYKIVFTISNTNLGGVRIRLGTGSFTSIYTDGTHTLYLQQTTTNDAFRFYADSSGIFNGAIDNVSVKEVGQDWTLSADSSIFQGFANVSSTNTYQYILQSGILTVGKKYKVEYTILNGSTGTLKLGTSFGVTPITSTVGTHSIIATALTTDLYIERETICDVNITNISVIEITDDTNLPRIDYSPYSGAGSCGHWLFEPQSTNLFTESENFSNGAWTLYGGATITANNAVSPQGVQNASKLTDVGGIYDQTPYNPDTNYVFSLFAKTNTATSITINFVDQSAGYLGGDIQYTFSTNVASVISQSANGSVVAEKEDYGNGWIRVILKFTTNVAQNYNYQSIEFQGGDGWIYGAQLEALPYATSYIPTEGSIKTRLADAAFGAGSSDLINSTEGVLYFEGSALANDSYRFLSLSDGSNSNNVRFNLSPIANQISFEVISGGSLQLGYTNNSTDVLSNTKIAIKYKLNDFAVWINGVEVNTDASGITPTGLNTLNFDRGTGSNVFFGKTKCVAVYKEALTDAELTCLTTI